MSSNSKIKICHIASGDLWAGAEAQIATLLSALTKYSQYEIHAVLYNSGRLADELQKSGIPVYVIEESQNNFFSLIYKTYKVVRNQRFEILHTDKYKENIIGLITKSICGIPSLVTTVYGPPELFIGHKKIKAELYSFINRKLTGHFFTRIITVSKELKRELCNNGCCPAKVVAIPNCVDMTNIKAKVDVQSIKRNLGIDPGTKIIGSVGRLVPIKGYNYFIRAAKKILEEMPNVKFILAGEGPIKQDLIKATEKLGIRKDFVFPGFVDDVYSLISAFDLFVLPSINEGIPIVLLESMALGIPIVATNVGGIPEILNHKVTGFLVASQNISELESACLYALINNNTVRLMMERAKDIVAKEFSPEKIAKQTSELYQSLINHNFRGEGI